MIAIVMPMIVIDWLMITIECLMMTIVIPPTTIEYFMMSIVRSMITLKKINTNTLRSPPYTARHICSPLIPPP